MIEDETATGEGMPEPKAKVPAKAKQDKEPEKAPQQPATVHVRVAGPMWCTGINLPLAGGGTLTVGRTGSEVSTDLLADLKQSAAKHGVTLEVSNS